MGLLVGGVLLWPLVFVLPISVAMVLYGVLPLGSPASVFTLEGQWPMILIVLPTVMTLVSFLTIRIYSASKGDSLKRIAIPCVHLIAILATTYMSEILCVGLVVTLRGNIDLLGMVSLGLTYSVTFLGLYLSERLAPLHTNAIRAQQPQQTEQQSTTTPSTTPYSNTIQQPQQPNNSTTPPTSILWAYFKLMVVVFVHFLWLIAFIIGYRETRWIPVVQPLLNFGMAIVVFIFKKVLLSLTDPFPLESAMLLSSLWLQNLSDIFQAMAYPSIVNPITYAYIWLIHLVANVAYLLFLTNTWFKFRVWIKGVLSCRCKHMPVPEEEDCPTDHGHSWNHPAYIRRQLRFFFWRVFSGVWAIIFYVCLSSILRLGPNRRYYPFSSDPYLLPGDSDNRNIFTLNWTDYGNSLLFVSVDSVALILAGLMGLIYAKRNFPDDLRKILFWKLDDLEEGSPDQSMKKVTVLGGHNHDRRIGLEESEFVTRRVIGRYIELVVSVLLYNALVSVLILQYHLKIWWAFETEAPHPRSHN